MSAPAGEKKRKATEEPEGEKPPLKRHGTMAATAMEGVEFVKTEASLKADVKQALKKAEAGSDSPPGRPVTRGLTRAREALDVLTEGDSAGSKRERHGKTTFSDEDSKKYREQLVMVFRLFDKNRDGRIDKREVADVMRSMGKRPLKRKIDQLFQAADADRSGSIDQDEFVNYFLEKRLRKLGRASAPSTTTTTTTTATTTAPSAPTTTTTTTATTITPPVATPTPTLTRGRSIADYYTTYAGLHDEITPTARDAFSNPEGREYDLGREGAFVAFSVVIYNAMGGAGDDDMYVKNAVTALRGKGFQVTVTNNEREFIAHLDSGRFEQAWFLSTNSMKSTSETEFADAVERFNTVRKGGLFIWADNDPLYAQANAVLARIGGSGFKLEGNDYGDKVLTIGDANTTQQFGRHLLTSGLVNLHEGITICFPSASGGLGIFTPLATNSSGRPCILYAEPPGRGRIVVDTGFTKLWDQYWAKAAGTERYVRNAAVWLLDLEHRIPTLGETRATDHAVLGRGEIHEIGFEGWGGVTAASASASGTAAGSGKIMVGLGWSSPFDLDASLLVYDKTNKHLETIYYGHLKSNKYPIKHSGDILSGSGEGDDEQITIDLTGLPDEVATMIVVVNVFTSTKNFSQVENAYARLLDANTREEKARFTLDKSSCGTKSGLIMCKLYRSFADGGKWKLMTIGEPADGNRADSMLGQVAKYVAEEYVPKGAKFSKLT